MQIVQAFDKLVFTTYSRNEASLVLRHKEDVLPNAIFERFFGIRRVGTETVKRRTFDWILVAPCTIGVARLKEARETCVFPFDGRGLICFPEVEPVA